MRPKFFKTLEMQMKLICALLGYYAVYSRKYLTDVWEQPIGPVLKGQESNIKHESRMQIKCLCDFIPVSSWIIVSRYIIAACETKMR